MRWYQRFFRREITEKHLDAELRFHVDQRIADLVATGMTPEEARRRAQMEFGGLEQAKEECRDVGASHFLEILIQDLRYGLRMLARNPGFAAVAVLTLALGIGANTAIFSLIDAVLFKMLPVQNSQQLVLLDWASHGSPEGIVNSISGNKHEDCRATCPSFSYPSFERIRDSNRVFSSVTAMATNNNELNLDFKGVPGRADGQLVAGTFFTTLGVSAILGRLLSPEDDRAGASPAAAISYGYWERRFGGDPTVVGQTITVNSVPFTIVGVSPPEFYGVQPGRAVEVWLPLHMGPQIEQQWWRDFAARQIWWVTILGRLKPGVSDAVARAELEVIFQQSISPEVTPRIKPQAIPHLGMEPVSKGLAYLRTEFSKPLLILMTVVALVLLIACANLANLLVARAASRQKEIAVRLALGAGRSRLIRQLLTENFMLAAIGGVVGTLWAFWGARLVVAFMSSGRNPIALNVTPDAHVLGFTVALSALTGIIFGLSPALRSTHLDLTPALKESAGLLGAARGKYGVRLGLSKVLVVAQASLSLVLLAAAGLFVRTLINLENVSAGFDRNGLLLFTVDPTQVGYKGRRLVDFYEELQRRLAILPGVQSVSLSMHTLVGGTQDTNGINVPPSATDRAQKGEALSVPTNWVGPKFLETMGIPILRGRTMNEADREGTPKVAVVNEKFVDEYLGQGNPIGRRFGFGGKDAKADIEIVGVVGDAKFTDLRSAAPSTIYAPIFQQPGFFEFGPMHFEMRTAGDPLRMASTVRRVAQDLDRNMALYEVQSEKEQISQSLFQERLFARLTGFFAVLGTLLACIGIYGIMAFSAGQRTHEIGIRMALGASRGDVLGLMLRDTLTLTALAIAVGIGIAAAASRLVSSFLYNLKATDPLTLGGAAFLMLTAAALAGYVPARRATKVDPMVALRYE